MFNSIFKFFTSLRLTVVCLAITILLVFFGTLAQVNEGLYDAQNRWFRSFFIYWTPGAGSGVKIPVFPGGYLVGIVLLINLLAAHIKRFQFTTKKLGIHLTHGGLILLLVGQLATDLLSRETQMRFAEGERKNFTESAMETELVVTSDTANPEEEKVVAIPGSLLVEKKEISHPELPFAVKVQNFYPNSRLRQRGPMVDQEPPPASRGIGTQAVLTIVPETKDPEQRNLPSAVIELKAKEGSLGTWLVSSTLSDLQEVEANGKTYRVGLRWSRQYLPYSIELLKTTHEVYRGTEIPKNFQSRIRIENQRSGENREVDIYMNNPLRYAGLTFFQYQMGKDELDANRGSSTLLVVKNPSWLAPYLGCVLVGGGMVVQFMMHLVGFVSKRRTA